VERADRPRVGELLVQCRGPLPGLGVDRDDAVDPRPVAVVGLDAVEIPLDESLARAVARPHGVVNLSDSRLGRVE